MLTRLVPWNDPKQLRSVFANICPELLMPTAVIDIQNIVILDERVDFVRISALALQLRCILPQRLKAYKDAASSFKACYTYTCCAHFQSIVCFSADS